MAKRPQVRPGRLVSPDAAINAPDITAGIVGDTADPGVQEGAPAPPAHEAAPVHQDPYAGFDMAEWAGILSMGAAAIESYQQIDHEKEKQERLHTAANAADLVEQIKRTNKTLAQLRADGEVEAAELEGVARAAQIASGRVSAGQWESERWAAMRNQVYAESPNIDSYQAAMNASWEEWVQENQPKGEGQHSAEWYESATGSFSKITQRELSEVGKNMGKRDLALAREGLSAEVMDTVTSIAEEMRSAEEGEWAAILDRRIPEVQSLADGVYENAFGMSAAFTYPELHSIISEALFGSEGVAYNETKLTAIVLDHIAPRIVSGDASQSNRPSVGSFGRGRALLTKNADHFQRIRDLAETGGQTDASLWSSYKSSIDSYIRGTTVRGLIAGDRSGKIDPIAVRDDVVANVTSAVDQINAAAGETVVEVVGESIKGGKPVLTIQYKNDPTKTEDIDLSLHASDAVATAALHEESLQRQVQSDHIDDLREQVASGETQEDRDRAETALGVAEDELDNGHSTAAVVASKYGVNSDESISLVASSLDSLSPKSDQNEWLRLNARLNDPNLTEEERAEAQAAVDDYQVAGQQQFFAGFDRWYATKEMNPRLAAELAKNKTTREVFELVEWMTINSWSGIRTREEAYQTILHALGREDFDNATLEGMADQIEAIGAYTDPDLHGIPGIQFEIKSRALSLKILDPMLSTEDAVNGAVSQLKENSLVVGGTRVMHYEMAEVPEAFAHMAEVLPQVLGVGNPSSDSGVKDGEATQMLLTTQRERTYIETDPDHPRYGLVTREWITNRLAEEWRGSLSSDEWASVEEHGIRWYLVPGSKGTQWESRIKSDDGSWVIKQNPLGGPWHISQLYTMSGRDPQSGVSEFSLEELRAQEDRLATDPPPSISSVHRGRAALAYREEFRRWLLDQAAREDRHADEQAQNALWEQAQQGTLTRHFIVKEDGTLVVVGSGPVEPDIDYTRPYAAKHELEEYIRNKERYDALVQGYTLYPPGHKMTRPEDDPDD